MLRVTVEMLPGGSEVGKKTLGQICIRNVSDLDAESLYLVQADDSWGTWYVNRKLLSHARRQSWVRLLWKTLGQIMDENPNFGKSHVA